MGKSGQQFDQLIALLAADGSANLAKVLKAFYHGQERKRALASLRQFRLVVAKAAKEAGISLSLSGDGKTRTPAEKRLVWFEGEDRLAEATEKFVIPNLDGPKRSAQDAVKLGPIRLLYVVFAEEDERDAERLLAELEPHFRKQNIKTWSHANILPGEDPARERARARESCDLTLQFLSPQFEAAGLGSVGTARVFPLILHEPAYPPQDVEVFRYRGRSFDHAIPRDFARELFLKIDATLAKTTRALEDRTAEVEKWVAPNFDGSKRYAQDALKLGHRELFVDGPASPVSLRRDIDMPQRTENRCDALTFLFEWLKDPNAPPYCALLGELGMGKTTTAKELARRLWDKHAKSKMAPMAVYLDLRLVGDAAKDDPDLDEIVGRILKRDWKGGPRSKPPEPDEIYKLMEDGALVIFDGLDEVLVHLTPSQGRQFTRQLFRMVPPKNAKRGRLLITCRTHYFRTIQEQSAHFTMEDRDSVRAENYRALVLLPFGEDQIRTYLKNSLPERNVDEAYAFLQSVHNLPELAERPYTLSLIARQFVRLEQWKAEGRPVTGLTLYRFVVEEWLLRDGGKHQFNPDHKQMLMEHVAAELTRSGARSWSAAQLEDWLMGFVQAHLAAHYEGVKRDLLKEDLRTATFLVRDDHDQFRFAHTSLQEYFLACYLRRALIDAKFGNWTLRGVSQETLNFLGQSLLEQPSEPARKGLAALRDTYHPQASELAFRYVLLALTKGYPAPPAAGFQLPGSDLWGLEVDHAGPGLLDLSGLNLRGARVANTFWRRCRLSESDFSSADAARAEWQDCDLSVSRWRGADLTAGLFRKCQVTDADYADALTHRAKWLRCPRLADAERQPVPGKAVNHRLQIGHSSTASGCAWSPDGRRVLSSSLDHTLKIWDAASGDCLLTLSGHSSYVVGCAWSPDGRRVLSSSLDHTLKIWDAASGDCLLTLSGHSSSVFGCAWSPDGHRVLSSSKDHTLKIWDAASGDCLLTLSGHSSSVFGCAWSPDGHRVLSSSLDHTLKIWDAASGDCLLTLSGHSIGVTGCAWSPDGRRVLSSSGDHTLKIWDAASGDCLLTLSGHSIGVTGCAWSPDGRRVLSSSGDNTLKIWDAASGDSPLTLSGHSSGVTGCAWSPDGRRVLSSSKDHTLKIWDAASGDSPLTLSGHSSSVTGCAWSPDGRRVLSSSWDNTLKIWDAASGDCLLTFSGHSSGLFGCAWSPDGRRVLSSSWDNTLKIWDAASGDCLLTLSGHSSGVTGCAWSPDGRRVLSSSWDNTLKIWDAASGDCLLTLSGHSGAVSGCAWSPHGRRVLSSFQDETLTIDHTLKIWDAASGDCLLTLSGHSSSVFGCAWSPDGRRVLSSSLDHTLKIWDAASGDCLLTLSGHSSEVTSCAWSPDGRRVLSSSLDHTLKIWDAASGDCLLTLSGHSIGVTSCAWSLDGRQVLAGFTDGSVSIFDASTLAETGPRCYHLLPPHSVTTWATFDPVSKRVLNYGEGAWRSVGCVIPDETGMPMWLPLEAFEEV